jgi:hypothetical protein
MSPPSNRFNWVNTKSKEEEEEEEEKSSNGCD